eukprot:TRINITY_DN6578_c0_g1_i1.p1 TRINITY_DN6578_c0_g1~~TRINITY_DN6578_c0_g1_i1.p1  ORF type:complete len:319 (+),score=51.59 TRINITY_DN6578_c0_g1_i1:48-1004(+)
MKQVSRISSKPILDKKLSTGYSRVDLKSSKEFNGQCSPLERRSMSNESKVKHIYQINLSQSMNHLPQGDVIGQIKTKDTQITQLKRENQDLRIKVEQLQKELGTIAHKQRSDTSLGSAGGSPRIPVGKSPLILSRLLKATEIKIKPFGEKRKEVNDSQMSLSERLRQSLSRERASPPNGASITGKKVLSPKMSMQLPPKNDKKTNTSKPSLKVATKASKEGYQPLFFRTPRSIVGRERQKIPSFSPESYRKRVAASQDKPEELLLKVPEKPVETLPLDPKEKITQIIASCKLKIDRLCVENQQIGEDLQRLNAKIADS